MYAKVGLMSKSVLISFLLVSIMFLPFKLKLQLCVQFDFVNTHFSHGCGMDTNLKMISPN